MICEICGKEIEYEQPFFAGELKKGKIGIVHLNCIFEKKKESVMTYERREEIFSKETISIQELKELHGISYQSAQKMMMNIRLACGRNDYIRGMCLVDDYISYFQIRDKTRYGKKLSDKDGDCAKNGLSPNDIKRHVSVCV